MNICHLFSLCLASNPRENCHTLRCRRCHVATTSLRMALWDDHSVPVSSSVEDAGKLASGRCSSGDTNHSPGKGQRWNHLQSLVHWFNHWYWRLAGWGWYCLVFIFWVLLRSNASAQLDCGWNNFRIKSNLTENDRNKTARGVVDVHVSNISLAIDTLDHSLGHCIVNFHYGTPSSSVCTSAAL